jgi:hypothetical protein
MTKFTGRKSSCPCKPPFGSSSTPWASGLLLSQRENAGAVRPWAHTTGSADFMQLSNWHFFHSLRCPPKMPRSAGAAYTATPAITAPDKIFDFTDRRGVVSRKHFVRRRGIFEARSEGAANGKVEDEPQARRKELAFRDRRMPTTPDSSVSATLRSVRAGR